MPGGDGTVHAPAIADARRLAQPRIFFLVAALRWLIGTAPNVVPLDHDLEIQR